MKEFMLNPEKQKDDHCGYSLMSILVHVGNRSNSGHYIAFMRPNMDNKWYKFNDEVISECSKKYVDDMSFGSEYMKTILDIDSFGTKKKKMCMMSQAYMLVYIRTSEIKNNLKPIVEESIEPWVRKRVEEERAEIKRREFWERHRVAYICMDSTMRGFPGAGCLKPYRGRWDFHALDQILYQPALRVAILLDKQNTIQHMLDEIASSFGVSSDHIFLWKLDSHKNWLVPLFTKKTSKDVKLKKIGSVLKPSFADCSVLYLQYLPQISPRSSLIEAVPRYTIISPDITLNTTIDHRYENCLAFVKQTGPFEPGVELKNENISNGNLLLLLIKTFTKETELVFAESRLMHADTKIENIGEMFPGCNVFIEVVQNGVYRPIELFKVARSRDTIEEYCTNFVGILVLMDKQIDREILINYYDNIDSTGFIRISNPDSVGRAITTTINLHNPMRMLFEYIRTHILDSKVDLDRITISCQSENNGRKLWYPDPYTLDQSSISELVTYLHTDCLLERDRVRSD
jgi:hypothetical protein